MAGEAYNAFVLVNFSATCGKDGNAAETIVEFPFAVLTTAADGEHTLASETRTVVRPRTGTIDPSRLARLGVAQEEVDNGDTLTEAVQQLEKTIEDTLVAEGKSYAVVVASAWDLIDCLGQQAAVDGYSLGAKFSHYIDLSVEVAKHLKLPEGTPLSLADMCTRLSVKAVEPSTSGLAAVKTMAEIVKELLSKGHSLVRDDLAGSKAGESAQAPAATTSVVRVRGVPWNCTQQDLKQFFAPLEFTQVHFDVTPSGRLTGEAFVKFPSEASTDEAVTYDRKELGSRYVEVLYSTAAEMDAAIQRTKQASVATSAAAAAAAAVAAAAAPASGQAAPSGYGYGPTVGVVKLRGLPYAVREADIANFFAGLRLTREMVHIVYMPDGRTTGEAFVEFAFEEDIVAAMAKNRERIGARWVELFRSSPEEMALAIRRAASTAPVAPGYMAAPAMAAPYGYGGYGAPAAPAADPAYNDVFLRLRGLPFSANEQDIMTFFASAQLAPIGIQMMMNAQGRKSGEAFVQFSTSEEARRGMVLHRANMGTRYVEVFHCTAAEVMSAVSAQQQMQAGGMGGAPGGYGAGAPDYDYRSKRGRYE